MVYSDSASVHPRAARCRRRPETASALRAKWVELILSQHLGVGESLPNIFLFQIRKIGDDLRGRHAVGHEVDVWATEMRRPRTVARPARRFGFWVMRSKVLATW